MAAADLANVSCYHHVLGVDAARRVHVRHRSALHPFVYCCPSLLAHGIGAHGTIAAGGRWAAAGADRSEPHAFGSADGNADTAPGVAATWLAASEFVGAIRALSDAIEAALLANQIELPTDTEDARSVGVLMKLAAFVPDTFADGCVWCDV